MISLSVCQSVSLSHIDELNALQIAIFHRSSPNLLPRQSPRKRGYALFLVQIQNISVRQTGNRINFHHFSDKRVITLTSNISKTVIDTMMGQWKLNRKLAMDHSLAP